MLRKHFCLLLPQGSFVSLHFLSVMPAILSAKEKSSVQPQVVEIGAGCSACAVIVDFVRGHDKCGVCVCVSLVLQFLNIIKWDAVTTNTMFGKIYWLSPNFTFDSQKWLHSSAKGGLVVIVSIIHTSLLIFWYCTNHLEKKLEIHCQLQHICTGVLLKHVRKFPFSWCDILSWNIHSGVWWSFRKDIKLTPIHWLL